jgi:hypothetical protein
MYWIPDGAASVYFSLAGVILVSAHSYFSFMNVYGQGWFKTLVKFNLIGLLYSQLLLFAIILELLVSVYTY